MAGRPSPLLLSAIGAALLAGLAAVVTMGTVNRVPMVNILVLTWLTVAYSISGLVAWWCRPANRFGPLMVLTGATTILSSLHRSSNEYLHTIGQLTDLLPLVLIVQVFLTFPTGRLHGRVEKLLIYIGYLASVGGQLVVMLLGGLQPHVLTVAERPGLSTALYNIVLTTVSLVALAGVVLLAVRRRTEGRPLRRSLTLLIDSFAVGLVMIAVLLLVGEFGGPAFPVVQRISLLLLGIAPVAFLAGLLEARLARSSIGDLVVELRGDPADLRTPLAGALRDPSLVLVYWLPKFAVWADEKGEVVVLPDDPSRVTMIDDDGKPMAALVHDPAMQLLADSADGVGYLLKDRISDVPEFIGAVRRVAAGGSAVDPTIVSTLLSRRRRDDPLAQLTPREREVLELMAAGNSNQGIADRLVITLRAVEKYVSSIFGKLGLPATGSESRRVLAVLLFLRT